MTRLSSPARAGARDAVGGLVLLGAAWAALASPALGRLDVRAGDALRRCGRPSIDRVAVATTDLGSLYAVGGAATTLAALGRRDVAAEVAAVGAAGWVASQASKAGVGRQRPYEAQGTARLIRPPTGTSFPSGHAAVATALGAVLARDTGGRVGPVVLGTLGPYVCVSRVYAGVHYPTDVIGGAGLGLLLAAAWRGPVARGGTRAVDAAARGARSVALSLARGLRRVAARG